MDIISTSMGLLLFLGLCGDGWRLRYKKISRAHHDRTSIGVVRVHRQEGNRRQVNHDNKMMIAYCRTSDRPIGFHVDK